MSLGTLPANLPPPTDDGAANHLIGETLPSVLLEATDDTIKSLGEIDGLVVIYIYPMTGRPDTTLPDNWDEIPGARGCTPQSCSFRDHYEELKALNSRVFGLSTQTNEYQSEAKARLHLPFELLSDSKLQLKALLKLPTFTVDGMELYKRLTMIVSGGEIVKTFYPVFPPNENAEQVLSWLRENA